MAIHGRDRDVAIGEGRHGFGVQGDVCIDCRARLGVSTEFGIELVADGASGKPGTQHFGGSVLPFHGHNAGEGGLVAIAGDQEPGLGALMSETVVHTHAIDDVGDGIQ